MLPTATANEVWDLIAKERKGKTLQNIVQGYFLQLIQLLWGTGLNKSFWFAEERPVIFFLLPAKWPSVEFLAL